MCANSATLVLEQGVNGYGGTSDTSLFEDRRDNSAGGFPYLFSGVNRTGSPRRALLKFDLPTTLTGNLIQSVSLRLVVDRGRPGTETHTVRKVTRGWNKGNLLVSDVSTIGQGATAQPGDATWNSSADGVTSWTVTGGDFAAATSGSGAVGSEGMIATVSGAGMAQDVQGWIASPASNFGWAVLGNEAAVWNAKRFVSSEGAGGQRPQLAITYVPAPPTAAGDWTLYE